MIDERGPMIPWGAGMADHHDALRDADWLICKAVELLEDDEARVMDAKANAAYHYLKRYTDKHPCALATPVAGPEAHVFQRISISVCKRHTTVEVLIEQREPFQERSN